MTRLRLALFVTFISMSLLQVALAQVTMVEVQGVEATRPQSPDDTGMVFDESIGEVQINIVATDAAGNPVEGAAVSWTVLNAKETPVYIVGSSNMMEAVQTGEMEAEIVIDGGMTDANGQAYLVVDSATAGDTKVFVTVDEVAGKTYDGRDMRVVWF